MADGLVVENFPSVFDCQLAGKAATNIKLARLKLMMRLLSQRQGDEEPVAQHDQILPKESSQPTSYKAGLTPPTPIGAGSDKSSRNYCLAVLRSRNHARSDEFGSLSMSVVLALIIFESRHFLISACPSAKDKPPALLW